MAAIVFSAIQCRRSVLPQIDERMLSEEGYDVEKSEYFMNWKVGACGEVVEFVT